jgi:glycine betaine/choline ABC-type transport system substrate-binding protein
MTEEVAAFMTTVSELARIGAHLAPGMAPGAFSMRSNCFPDLESLYGIEP